MSRRRFAEEVFSVYNDGDVVWVQDYHLMLLPALLKKEKPKMKVYHVKSFQPYTDRFCSSQHRQFSA